MNRFLLGALAMGAVFVLTSFALTRASTTTTGGPAWTVSQYQLDRAFRLPGLTGTFSAQAPATSGFIITQIKVASSAQAQVTIGINGVTETFGSIFYGSGNVDSVFQDLNPPLIVRPNDVVSFSSLSIVTIAGYTTLPGET